MATITTRAGKGTPLSNAEVDANFTNLNDELATKANTSSLANYQPLLGYTPVNKAGDNMTGDLMMGSSWIYMGYTGSDSLRMNAYGVGFDFFNQTQGVWADLRARQGYFNSVYDRDNTAYYLDPNATSNFLGLTVTNTITGSISGNAATATNISNTGTVTLATATESNSIYATAPSYTAGQPTKLLNFDWYSNVFSLGNIRGGSTDSEGLGVFYTPSGGNRAEVARYGIAGGLTINNGSSMTSGWNRTLYLAASYPVIVMNSSNTKYSGIGVDASVADSGMRFWVNGSSADVTGTGTSALTINTGNYVSAAGSFRAPTFYDSNNTGYYADPSGTSNFSGLAVASRISGGIDGDARAIYGFTGANNGGLQYWNTINNTTLNPDANYWYGIRLAHGDADTYYNATLAVSFFADDLYLRRKTGGTDQTWRRFWHNGDSTISASGDFRAPIFYDSADTGYYADLAGNNVLNTLYLKNSAGANVLAAQSSYFGYSAGYKTIVLGKDAQTTVCIGVDPIANASGSFNGGGNGVEVMFKNGAYFITPNSTNNGYHSVMQMLDNNVYFGNAAFASDSFRAPIFYDSQNTAYFCDPNGTSVLNVARATTIQHSSGNTAIVLNEGAYTRLCDPSGTTKLWLGNSNDLSNYYNNTTHYFRNSASTILAQIDGSGTITAVADARAPIFYDSNDTTYYLDPNSTDSAKLRGYLNFNDYGAGVVGLYSASRYQLVFAMGRSYTGAIDGTNVTTGYGLWWSHPNAGGVAANLNTHGLMSIVNGAWEASLASSTRAATDMRAPIFYDLSNTGYYLDANATGTSLNVAGSIVAAGNVTAYSDRRVKSNLAKITNALAKVASINGYTFTRTDLFDKERVYGGVIAQEIEAVLPEAIFDNGNMKSVDYNATIGLLIEAIKQLKSEVDSLKSH